MIAALYIDPDGPYPKALGAECCWDESRDARKYAGPHPVVAHPPCARWSKLAQSVYARTGKEEHRPGNDGGCFERALHAVRLYGGVLEHPAQSKAWSTFQLPKPDGAGWLHIGTNMVGSVCEVWQSAYGHLASKRTWLLYCGKRPPFELRWQRPVGTHVVGYDSKRERVMANPKPTLTRKQAIHTPPEFLQELVRLAEWSRF